MPFFVGAGEFEPPTSWSRTKPIEDKYEYLFLDGIYDKLREIGLERKILLCGLGMTRDGTKEILSFHLVDTESFEMYSHDNHDFHLESGISITRWSCVSDRKFGFRAL